MTIIAIAILAFGGILVAARLGLDLGYERGYREGVDDAAAAIERDLERSSSRAAYLRHFGGQIDAGKRGEN